MKAADLCLESSSQILLRFKSSRELIPANSIEMCLDIQNVKFIHSQMFGWSEVSWRFSELNLRLVLASLNATLGKESKQLISFVIRLCT